MDTSSLKKLLSFRYQKNENQMANRTLNFEARNGNIYATMGESFSLVQNILFIDYTDVLPAHE